MAQTEPGDVIAYGSGGQDGAGGSGREADYSGVAAGDEFFTAVAPTKEAGKYATAGMSEMQIRTAIETSREQGWSELAYPMGRDGAAASWNAQDALVWENLKSWHPNFFRDLSDIGELELGRVIAEGGQAVIYEAKLNSGEYVAKVFKMEGFSLAELQRHWPLATKFPHPLGSIPEDAFVFSKMMLKCSSILSGTFLKDGRFAFLMPRYWGDLRTLINLKLKDNNSQAPPFSQWVALDIMEDIAEGMKDLHARGVLHRDLKAANVLVAGDDGIVHWCEVADYESAMLVQGTGFWRAPEVLEELLKKESDRSLEIWTEKVDVYSYAMTFYEVLTGHLPFDGYVKSDWKRVIDGERPHLPDYIDSRVCELVERCWHKEPSERPTFEVILADIIDLKDLLWRLGSSFSYFEKCYIGNTR